MPQKILYLDAVTTGYNPNRHSIYRIGGIIEADGIETKRFELKVRPWNDSPIASASLWISGETRTSVETFPEQAAVFAKFIEIINSQVDLYDMNDKMYIASFNASQNEIPFLKAWFNRNHNTHFADYFHLQGLDLGVIASFALMDKRKWLRNFHEQTVAEYLGVRRRASREFSCLDGARTSLEMYHALRVSLGFDDNGPAEEIRETERNF